MNFTERIFKRMDLQQLCSFILDGMQDFDIENDTYENRLDKGRNIIYKRLESICKNEAELNEVFSDLSDILIAYESVYMEIGMKFGARMIYQLLNTNEGQNL